MSTEAHLPPDAASGIAGLDDILGGGFMRESLFLVEGRPGTGKTTMALQFLMAGEAVGERGLYITLSEMAKELRHIGDPALVVVRPEPVDVVAVLHGHSSAGPAMPDPSAGATALCLLRNHPQPAHPRFAWAFGASRHLLQAPPHNLKILNAG